MNNDTRLAFELPERGPVARDKAHLTEHRKTRSWAKELPLANIGETARRVYTALTEFNRTEMPDVARLKVAEQLREPVRFVAENLQKRYMDAAFPLQPQVRKIAVLNRALHAELATAYKIVIARQADPGRRKVDRKLVAIAAARAMRCLQTLMLHSTLVYEPHPEGAWREMHSIFRFLDQTGLKNVGVKDEIAKTSTSVEELYRRSLLFALVSPYRLRQREMLALLNALPEWTSFTDLIPTTRARPGEQAFVIDPTADQPALYHTLGPEHLAGSGYVFRTKQLAERLRKLVEDTDNEDQRLLGGSVLPKTLLRQLIQAWSSAPKRQFVRTRLNFDLELTIGLEGIHELLRRMEADAQPESQAAEAEEDPDLTAEELESFDRFTARIYSETEIPKQLNIEDEDSVFLHAQATVLEHDPAPSWSNRPDREMPKIHSFRTLNESAGGYCISWEGEEVPQVKVGELVGVRSVKSPTQFAVGAVRWMKNEQGDGHQLGIEMLAPSSSAVELRALGSAQKAPRRGLLLPQPKGEDQGPTLLTPPMAFSPDQTLGVSRNGSTQRIRLTQQVEVTGAFSRYRFADLDQPPSEREPSQRGEEGFDNLWDAL